MAYALRVAENVEWLEVYPGEPFDQGRVDHGLIEEQLKTGFGSR